MKIKLRGHNIVIAECPERGEVELTKVGDRIVLKAEGRKASVAIPTRLNTDQLFDTILVDDLKLLIEVGL